MSASGPEANGLGDGQIEGVPAESRGLLARDQSAAWLVFGGTLSLLFLLWMGLRAVELRNGGERFALLARETVRTIVARLGQHEQILLGGAGLFDASDRVTRDEWHRYVERLDLADTYPGIQAVGFSAAIPAADLGRHEAAVRREGFPGYAVWPPEARPFYTAITYLEPFSGRNLAAFGYDMFSEPVRAAAMRRAAETGRTAMSGKVRLVQETSIRAQAGFLMYVPVFGGPPPADREARMAALRGFVFSPYRMDDLMRGILGESPHQLDFTIHDGDAEERETLMYASRQREPGASPVPARFSERHVIEAYGHRWTIRFESRPAFEKEIESRLDTAVLILGGSTSLLLFGLVTSLASRRRRAETLALAMTARIRRDERRLANIIEGTRVGTWEWNVQTGETVFNERWAEIVGYTLGELQPVSIETWLRLAHPDDVRISGAALERHFAGADEFYDVECRMLHKDGHWVWVHDRGRVVSRSVDGKPLMMYGTHADISARKLAESELNRFKTTLDRTLDCVFMFDADKLLFFYANEGAIRLVGYTREQLQAMHPYDLKPDYPNDRFQALLERLRAGERPAQTFETEFRTRGGSSVPVEVFLQYVAPRDEPARFVAIVRDIAERKRMEGMKEEFVATVSHELRTPLTAIGGALGLVAGGALGTLPAPAREMIGLADRNCRRLGRLIDDLLDMEKVSAGKMHFDLAACELPLLVGQAVDAARGLGDRNSVRLRIGRLDPAVAVVDAERLLQALANLLSNAVKFSPPEGEVEVVLRVAGPRARIAVHDQGAGIPEPFRARIFEKFSQADGSDSRRRGGTGLGLSITRALVRQMGGEVDFESVAGAGTTFYIDLPIVAGAPGADLAGSPQP